MNVYAPIILCFIPFITMFLLFAILVPGISVLHEIFASLAGLVAFIPIVLLQFLIPELRLFSQVKVMSILLYSLIFCGLIEECLKAASLLILKVKGESLLNFFLYSLLAGMILGCFESVVYLLQLIQTNNTFAVPLPPAKLIHLRMGTALVIHTLCAGLGGLCVFYCKNLRRSFSPLVYAIVIHGVYDFFVAFDSPLKYFSIAVILLAALECRIFYNSIKDELFSKRTKKTKISDPNKTLEMPKNPAIIIPVKKTMKENVIDEIPEDTTEDFDEIQREAEAAIKKSEKRKSKKVSPNKKTTKMVSKVVSSKTKPSEKTVATKTKSTTKTKTTSKAASGSKKTVSKTTTKKTASKTSSKPAPKKSAPKATRKK